MAFARRLLTLLIIGLTFSCPVILAQNQGKKWHETKNIISNAKSVNSMPDLDVFSAPNLIILKINRATEIRLFSILGKLISSQHLEPGLYQYQLDSHGIYIVKTDNSSCKIAI